MGTLLELLVGLPPAHYGKYRKKFQQYFQRDGKVVGFKYGGTSYQILIHVKSFDDIGGILNMTAKQAENSYYNAIRKIRKQMGDNFG